MENRTDKTKFNWNYLGCLVACLITSIVIIKPFPTQTPELIFSNGNPKQHIFSIESQNQISMILSEALGSTLNLSWYDVCFYNNSFVTKNGATTSPVILEATIFPLNTNKSLLDLQKGLEFMPQLNNQGTDTTWKMISGEKIAASVGLGGCLHMPASEGGFEYSLFMLEKTKDQYGTPILIPVSLPNIGTITPYPLDVGSVADSRQLNLGNTTLEVKNNFYALWIKRFIFISLILAFIESLIQVKKKLFRKN